MANTDNEMGHLAGYARLKSDHFDEIFELQRNLQKRLGTNFDELTLKEASNFALFNKHALEDEIGEMMDALGGIHDGIGSAVWKNWKRDHKHTEHLSVQDLTSRDLVELKYEVVDMFHFFINFALLVGMSGSELFSMYLSKNRENHDRQSRGY